MHCGPCNVRLLLLQWVVSYQGAISTKDIYTTLSGSRAVTYDKVGLTERCHIHNAGTTVWRLEVLKHQIHGEKGLTVSSHITQNRLKSIKLLKHFFAVLHKIQLNLSF